MPSLCFRRGHQGEVLQLLPCGGTGAEAITDKLTEVLATMQIDVPGGLVAQCYDGASTMSGRLHGV